MFILPSVVLAQRMQLKGGINNIVKETSAQNYPHESTVAQMASPITRAVVVLVVGAIFNGQISLSTLHSRCTLE